MKIGTSLRLTGLTLVVGASSLAPSIADELHVVGIYSGITSPGSGSRNHEPGEAAVRVNRPGQHVTLFLNAYEPVTWHMEVSESTIIDRVITSGYYRQAVVGLAAGVPVTSMSFVDGNGYLYIGSSVDSGEFYQAVPIINQLTGLEISSFHGADYAPYPAPFVIESVQDDPRLSSNYPQPVPLSELPALTFQMSFYPPGPTGQVMTRSYTLGGAQDGGPLLPAMRAVPDDSGRFYYGTEWHTVWKIDGQNGTAETQTLPPQLPELSWPMGMAFDSQRHRVLLVSLGGEGFLYAYQQQWTLLRSMDNHDLDCLEYHAPQDALYGLTGLFGGSGGRPGLQRFSASGVYQSEIQLPVVPFNLGPAGHGSEVVSVGEYLVVLLQSEALSSYARPEARMYLVNPRTGEFWLTYRRVGGLENQRPTVNMLAPTQNTSFVAGTTIRLEANAYDVDGSVTALEFYADGQPLGPGQSEGGSIYFMNWTGALNGQHTLMARATDNSGAQVFSGNVEIHVTPNDAGPPVTLVAAGSVWKYLDNGSDQGAAWRESNFNDLTWLSGQAQLGYGDGDEVTQVSYGPNAANKFITTYFRRAFLVQNAGDASHVLLRLLCDDGAVVYLNGAEVFRSNMPDGPITYATLAVAAVGGEQESTFQSVSLPSNVFIDGVNVLAVEVHQVNPTSSDLSFDLSLEAQGVGIGDVLPSLSFQVAFHTVGTSDGVRLRDFTLAGPADGQRLLPAMRVVPDNAGRFYYGNEWQQIFRVDSQTGGEEQIVQPPELEEAGWVMGVAFDSVRDRVPVVSLSGEGYLYAYYPVTAAWNLISSMNNLDFNSLVYHPADDGLYGVGVTYGEVNAPFLFELNAQGTLLRQLPLPTLPFSVGPGNYQSQLVSVGNYLILLLERDYRWGDGPGESRIYLIEPSTGRSWLTYRRTTAQNNPPIVNLVAPSDGTTYIGPIDLELDAYAYDPDSDASLRVEFFDGTELIGADTEPASSHYTFSWHNVPLGDHTITARAIEPSGAVTISAPIHISVLAFPLPVVSIEALDSSASEPGSNSGVLVVSRFPTGDAPLRVYYERGGTATEGLDYESLPGSVEIPAGEESAQILIQPVDDALIEPTELVELTLINPPLNTLLPPPLPPYLINEPDYASARVTIYDDDTPPPPPPPPEATNVTLIPLGAVWKYLDDGSDQGVAWRASDFNDDAWPSGPGQLGYGDGDETTVLQFGSAMSKYITYYLRHAFEVTDASRITGLAGHMIIDDGAVIYLNGIEVFRFNLPSGPINFDTLALQVTENQQVDFGLPPDLLIDGANVLAVEVHQQHVVSSDISFDLSLKGALPELSVSLMPQTMHDIHMHGLCVVLHGTTSGTFVLEYSTDLIHWTSLQTKTVTPADCQMIDATAMTGGPMRFYRVRSLPTP